MKKEQFYSPMPFCTIILVLHAWNYHHHDHGGAGWIVPNTIIQCIYSLQQVISYAKHRDDTYAFFIINT